MNAPYSAGSLDCAEEVMLVIAGDANAGEVGAHEPQQREQDPQRTRQPRDSCLQLGDADVKGRDGLIEERCGRDRRERPLEPACHGRAWDTDPRGDRAITRVSDEAQEAVVVASLRSLGRHPGIVPVMVNSALVRHLDPAGCAGNRHRYVDSGTIRGPRLLPDLGGFGAYATFTVLARAHCGLTRFFADKDARGKLADSIVWTQIP